MGNSVATGCVCKPCRVGVSGCRQESEEHCDVDATYAKLIALLLDLDEEEKDEEEQGFVIENIKKCQAKCHAWDMLQMSTFIVLQLAADKYMRICWTSGGFDAATCCSEAEATNPISIAGVAISCGVAASVCAQAVFDADDMQAREVQLATDAAFAVGAMTGGFHDVPNPASQSAMKKLRKLIQEWKKQEKAFDVADWNCGHVANEIYNHLVSDDALFHGCATRSAASLRTPPADQSFEASHSLNNSGAPVSNRSNSLPTTSSSRDAFLLPASRSFGQSVHRVPSGHFPAGHYIAQHSTPSTIPYGVWQTAR